jgi:hypothetical protein
MYAVTRCYGEVDQKGRPVCRGAGVERVRAQQSIGDAPFVTDWCADCQATAREQGYSLLSLSDEEDR